MMLLFNSSGRIKFGRDALSYHFSFTEYQKSDAGCPLLEKINGIASTEPERLWRGSSSRTPDRTWAEFTAKRWKFVSISANQERATQNYRRVSFWNCRAPHVSVRTDVGFVREIPNIPINYTRAKTYVHEFVRPSDVYKTCKKRS